MTLYSPGGLNLADVTAPLILAYDDSGTKDVVFAVSSGGDLTITPDGGDVTVDGTFTAAAGSFTTLAAAGASSGATVASFTGFDVTSTVLAVFQRSDGGVSARIHYETSDGTVSFGTSTAHPTSLFSNSTERLRITSTGAITIAQTLGVTGLITATVGIKLGTTVTLSEGSANVLELASGDSFRIANGRFSVGAASDASVAVYIGGGTNITTGTTQYGVLADLIFNSTATTAGNMGQFRLRTEAAVFTMATGRGIIIEEPILGAGSIVTTLIGLDIFDQTSGGTNYAIRTGLGLVQFGDDVLTTAGMFTMAEITTPSALANYGRIYTKVDNKMYFQDGAGTEHEVAYA